MLILGTLLIAASLACLGVAFADLPTGRVPRERLAAMTVVESRPLLARLLEGLSEGVDDLLRRRGWRPFSAEELELSGTRTALGTLVVTVVAVGFGVFVVVALLAGHALPALLAAALVPFCAKGWLRWKVARRRRRFADQLPGALQMMAASLRAGHSLPRSLDAVSQEADEPMASELARVVNENRLGRDLVPALESVAGRMDSIDFGWVAGAIAAQRESGGNLNEILDQVSETIRERHHIRQQVRSLSAEGRLSAYILMALPVLLGLYYAMVASQIMTVFLGTLIGKLLIAGSLVLYVLGGFWMRSVVRIEF